MNGVGSGFVHGFARRHILRDFVIGKRPEGHLRRFGFHPFKSRSDHANAGDDLVRLSGKQTQHARCVLGIGRLLQQMFANYHYGIGPKYRVVGMPGKDGASFIASQPLRISERCLARSRFLRHVSGVDGEVDARIAQQFRAPGRSGSKNQHAFRFYLRNECIPSAGSHV